MSVISLNMLAALEESAEMTTSRIPEECEGHHLPVSRTVN